MNFFRKNQPVEPPEYGNVTRIIGKLPKPEKTIGDMKPGHKGYTVTWAYDLKSNVLREDYHIRKEKGGTASLWVECVSNEPNLYVIEFERPIYRNIFSGSTSTAQRTMRNGLIGANPMNETPDWMAFIIYAIVAVKGLVTIIVLAIRAYNRVREERERERYYF